MRQQEGKKAVTYARVAGGTPGEVVAGLAAQEQRCRAYALARGYEITETFRDSGSGNKIDRPGLGALRAFLRDHQRDPHVVLVTDIQRIARPFDLHLSLAQDMLKSGGLIEVADVERFNSSERKLKRDRER